MSRTNRNFEYDGRKLLAKSKPIDGGYEVRVFEGEQPVGKAAYSVTWEVKTDMRLNGYDAVESLLEMAEEDFVRSSNLIKTHNPDDSLK